MVGEWVMDWADNVEKHLNEPIFQVPFANGDVEKERFVHFWQAVQFSIRFPLIGGESRYLLNHYQFSPWGHLGREICYLFPLGREEAPKEMMKVRKDGLIEVDGRVFHKCSVNGKFAKTKTYSSVYHPPETYGFNDLYLRLPWAAYQLMKIEFEDAKRVFSDDVFMKIREQEVKRKWPEGWSDHMVCRHIGGTKPLADYSGIDFNPSHADQASWYAAVMVVHLCWNAFRLEQDLWFNKTKIDLPAAHRFIMGKFHPRSPMEMRKMVYDWWWVNMPRARREISDVWRKA